MPPDRISHPATYLQSSSCTADCFRRWGTAHVALMGGWQRLLSSVWHVAPLFLLLFLLSALTKAADPTVEGAARPPAALHADGHGEREAGGEDRPRTGDVHSPAQQPPECWVFSHMNKSGGRGRIGTTPPARRARRSSRCGGMTTATGGQAQPSHTSTSRGGRRCQSGLTRRGYWPTRRDLASGSRSSDSECVGCVLTRPVGKSTHVGVCTLSTPTTAPLRALVYIKAQISPVVVGRNLSVPLGRPCLV